jgi:CBS domain-containing protein
MNCPSCGHENLEGSDRCENCLAPFRDLDVPRVDSAEGLARSVMEDNLAQLDQEETITVAPDTPAIEVARLMKNSNTGCALVVEGKKLVGIFTEHDVLLRMTSAVAAGSVGIATGSAGLNTGTAGVPPAAEREARNIRTGSVSDRVEQEQEAAAGGRNTGSSSDRGSSPTVREGVEDESHTDIRVEELPINEMPFSEVPFEEMRAEEMMFEELTTTTEIDVSDDPPSRPHLQIPVSKLMSRNPETLHERDSVAEAVNKMSLGRFRHIPFLKSDGTYAVASIKSVLKYIAQEDW